MNKPHQYQKTIGSVTLEHIKKYPESYIPVTYYTKSGAIGYGYLNILKNTVYNGSVPEGHNQNSRRFYPVPKVVKIVRDLGARYLLKTGQIKISH